jgi:hypothetical protein
MAQFTPGPWTVARRYDVTDYPVYGIHGVSGEEKRFTPSREANARLIAAAPELYEFAESVANHPSNYDPELVAKAEALIAKVDGGN